MLHWLAQSNGFITGLAVWVVILFGNSAWASQGPVDVRETTVFSGLNTGLSKQDVSKREPWVGLSSMAASEKFSLASAWPQASGTLTSDFSRIPALGFAPGQTFDLGALAQGENLDLSPEIIQNSPVLQDWLQDIPDISDEIRNQPSFRTRIRAGYAHFPSSGQASGVSLGVEDVFLIAGTGLTASGSFNRSWNDQRESFGAEARYYLLPLGSYVNLAPTLGYRSLETPDYVTNGLDLGFRLMIIPSRGGGADIAVSQRWVAPGSETEIGMTSISLGYAVTSRLRLGTDVEFQNSRAGQDSHLGLLLEWLL